jgi:leucyl aminopeptidase
MQIEAASSQPSRVPTDVLVFGVYGRGGRRSPAWEALNRAIGGGLASLLKVQGWNGKPGEVAAFPAPPGLRGKLVVLASIGERGASGPNEVRELAARAAERARKGGLTRVAFFLDCAMDERGVFDRPVQQAIGEGLEHGAYRFDQHLSKKDDGWALSWLWIWFRGRKEREGVESAVGQGMAIGRAQNIARTLVNEPANVVTPESLVAFAKKLAAEKKFQITVLDEAACQERNMNAFLAVGRGSSFKSALVHMVWSPKGAQRRVALVGKALTFDSGGLCLKPADGQLTMKMDMGGAAAVLGVMAAVADLALPVEVHGIFGATENMTGSAAYHTGDILHASNGKTIEVVNTDAEGRLTLADALVYACEQKPEAVVDIATLTGACMVGLGLSVAGLMGTGRQLMRDLKAAGDRAGEAMWELPMPDEYRELIQSKQADLANVGPRWGGAITAALFLEEFVHPEIPWAHIDIAGPAYAEKPLRGRPFGATGFPVRALVEWLRA